MSDLKHKSFAFKADSVSDNGNFTGYASVFGNMDCYREVVAPGAFTDSIKRIKESGNPLPVLWQHRSGEPIGGSDVLRQDEHGLKVGGWLLVNEVARAKEAHALMKAKVVTGLSIGYYVTDDSYNEKERIRTLKALDLVEYSIVTFPANDQAQIDTVKSLLGNGKLPTLSEFEDFLRESGFSKSQATAIAGKGLRELLRSESDSAKIGEIAALFGAFKESFSKEFHHG
jgi:HK97 family phage prohead protease